MHSSSLGSQLRVCREAQGLSLDAVAKATKIQRSLLADLERDDLSRWPAGIYRRGLVREYAKAIRFPAERVLEEVCGLSSNALETVAPHSGGSVSGHGVLACDSSELRLALAGPPPPMTRRMLRGPLAATAFSLGSVLAIGSVASVSTDVAYWTACGMTALVWYPSLAMCGVARDALQRRRSRTRRSVEFANRDAPATCLSVHPAQSAVGSGDAASSLRDVAVYMPSAEHPTLH